MRLFLAIELPEDARAHLVRLQKRLDPALAAKASLTLPQNLHITLKFLGDVDERKTKSLIESLANVRAGGAFDLFAEKIECFPERGPVRVVAAGFGGSIPAIGAVHQAIEQRCKFLGFERETRAYRPHATLARARNAIPASARKDAVEACADLLPAPTFVVNEFVLFESKLRPEGAAYIPRHRFAI